MITHDNAIRIIQQHGLTNGWAPTSYHRATNTWEETTSFYHEFGIRDTYVYSEVRAWLGY